MDILGCFLTNFTNLNFDVIKGYNIIKSINKLKNENIESKIELIKNIKTIIYGEKNFINGSNEINRINLTKFKKKLNKNLKKISSMIDNKDSIRKIIPNKGFLKILKPLKLKYDNYNFLLTIKDIKKRDIKLEKLDFMVLGIKIINTNNIIINILKETIIHKFIVSYLYILDIFFYFTDENNKEIEYFFTYYGDKLNNNITFDDINSIFEILILFLLFDLDSDLYDEYKENDYIEKYNNGEKITLKKINNPLNLLVHIDNKKINLPKELNKSNIIDLFNNEESIKKNLLDSFFNISKLQIYKLIHNLKNNDIKKDKNDYYLTFASALIDIIESYNNIFINNLIILKTIINNIKLKTISDYINTNNLNIDNSNIKKGGDIIIPIIIALVGILSEAFINDNVKKKIKTKIYDCVIRYPYMIYVNYKINDINNLTYSKYIEISKLDNNNNYSPNNKTNIYYKNSLLELFENSKYTLLLEFFLNISFNKLLENDINIEKNSKNNKAFVIEENKKIKTLILNIFTKIGNILKQLNNNTTDTNNYTNFFFNNLNIIYNLIEKYLTNILYDVKLIHILNILNIIPILLLSISYPNKNETIKLFIYLLNSLNKSTINYIRNFIYFMIITLNIYNYSIQYHKNLNLNNLEDEKIFLIIDKIGKLLMIDNSTLINNILLIMIEDTFTINELFNIEYYHTIKNSIKLKLDNKNYKTLFGKNKKLLINILNFIIDNKIKDNIKIIDAELLIKLDKKLTGGNNSNSNNSLYSARNSLNTTPNTSSFTSPNTSSKTTPNTSPFTTPNITPNTSIKNDSVNTEYYDAEDEINEKSSIEYFKTMMIMLSMCSLTNNDKIENPINKLNKKLNKIVFEEKKKLEFNEKIINFTNRMNILFISLYEWIFIISHSYIECKLHFSIHKEYNYLLSKETYETFKIINEFTKFNDINNLEKNNIKHNKILFINF